MKLTRSPNFNSVVSVTDQSLTVPKIERKRVNKVKEKRAQKEESIARTRYTSQVLKKKTGD